MVRSRTPNHALQRGGRPRCQGSKMSGFRRPKGTFFACRKKPENAEKCRKTPEHAEKCRESPEKSIFSAFKKRRKKPENAGNPVFKRRCQRSCSFGVGRRKTRPLRKSRCVRSTRLSFLHSPYVRKRRRRRVLELSVRHLSSVCMPTLTDEILKCLVTQTFGERPQRKLQQHVHNRAKTHTQEPVAPKWWSHFGG